VSVLQFHSVAVRGLPHQRLTKIYQAAYNFEDAKTIIKIKVNMSKTSILLWSG
jgi:hypothetical protein